MLDVEYIAPDGKLIEHFEMADGMTLEQAARTIYPDSGGEFPVPTFAIVGSKPAVRKLGDWKIKLSNAKIQFRQIPMGGGGGGSNTMQMVMQIAIIAAAAAATWWLGGEGGYLAAAGMGLTTANTLAAVAGAGIMILGTLLQGALFPQKLPTGQLGAMSAEQSSPTYSINASGNQARLYQQEPECFGRMKIVPDFVANTWTQYIGNDQIGYFVYGIGRGHYDVESLQFGETVFWKNGQFVESGYTNEGTPQSIWYGQELVRGAGYGNPVMAVGDGQETKTIGIEVGFPNGLCNYETQIQSSGNADDGYIDYVVQVKKNRTASISVQGQQIDNAGNPVGDWFDLGTNTFTNDTDRSFTRTVSFSMPGFKRWRIRAANVSQEQTSSIAPREKMVLNSVSYTPPSVAIEIVEPGNPVTIFPDNVITSTEVSGQELFAPNDEEFAGAIGPYATNSPGTKTYRLLFDFVFQQGLGRYNDQGQLEDFEVTWRIDYRAIDDFGQPVSGWATLDTISEKAATLTPQRITKTYDVSEGRYEVRVVRTSDTDTTGRTMDSLIWNAMRAMLPGTYEYPITCIALSIRASNTLTQSASRQFSAIVTRKLPLYDRQTKTWSEEVTTRSWAAAVSHVCKCEWGGRLKDHNIDLDTLWRIDEILLAKGWHYDSYIDGPYLVWNLLCEMCQSQCVIPRLLGPILSFVQDEPGRAPSFALTPRNIVRNTFSLSYLTWSDDTPDDVTIEYLDDAYGFQQRDVTAKLPESESREPSSLNILGITNRSHAFQVAVAYAAHNRWQRIVAECQVEALGRLINKGDICTVAHPRFKNTGSGIVTGWDQSKLEVCIHVDHRPESDNGFYFNSPYDPSQLMRLGRYGIDVNGILVEDNEPTLFIDPDIPSSGGLNLGDGEYLSLMRQDGSVWGPCKLTDLSDGKAVFDSADYATLLLQGQGDPFEWMTRGVDRQPTIWTLYKSKIYQRLMVVDSVQSQDLLHYNLRLLNYDDRIYQYDDLPVPIWQGRGQLPTIDTLDYPQNLRGIAINSSTLMLTWLNVARAQWYEVETSPNGVNWQNRGRANIGQITLEVQAGDVYARVRAANDQLVSDWAHWQGNTTLVPPGVPTPSLTDSYRGGEATITWPAVSGAGRYAIALRAGANVIYSASTTDLTFSITPEIQQGGPYRSLVFAISAIGAGGNSQEAQINIQDNAPVAPTSVSHSVSGNSMIIESISPALPIDGTGYVLVEGDRANFGVYNIREMRQMGTLPYTWSGLPAGTHYFRAAIKDEFFEIAKKPLDLQWSEVFTATIG